MTKEYFGHKFEVTKFSSIADGRTKVRYSTTNFYAEADQAGVIFNGVTPLIGSHSELQDYARFVSDVWTEHMRLAPKIETNLAGH